MKTTVKKIQAGELVLLNRKGSSAFGGREYFILTKALVYEINGRTVRIEPGFVTDRASVYLYALQSLFNRLRLWRVVDEPAVLHDWMPSEPYSDTVFRHAIAWEFRDLRGIARALGFVQRWIMYLALTITYPLRGWLAKAPRLAVMQAAEDYCDRHNTPFRPYITHN